MSPSLAAIKDHYSCFWNSIGTEIRWTGGRFAELPPGFSVLEFPPSAKRPFWTYASCGMSVQADAPPLETFLLSERQDASIAELVTALAHYHVTGAYLGLSHTVNFGRPWLDDSTCDHGLLSLPLSGWDRSRMADNSRTQNTVLMAHPRNEEGNRVQIALRTRCSGTIIREHKIQLPRPFTQKRYRLEAHGRFSKLSMVL